MEGINHEKEYELIRAFVAGKGSVEVLGRKSMENMGSIDGIILHSHCSCISVYIVFFRPFALEALPIGTLLGCRGFLVTL